jgi:hypothetical protein
MARTLGAWQRSISERRLEEARLGRGRGEVMVEKAVGEKVGKASSVPLADCDACQKLMIWNFGESLRVPLAKCGVCQKLAVEKVGEALCVPLAQLYVCQ